MKNNNTVDPNIYYKWLSVALNDFYKGKQEINLELNESISNILKPLEWLWYDWVLLLTTIEIEFAIEIPDEWAKEDMALTLGELLANLATLEVNTDKSFGFRKVMALGYLNIDIEEEKEDKNKDTILN